MHSSVKKATISLTILALILLNSLLLYQTFFVKETDFAIQNVQTQTTDDQWKYRIQLQGTTTLNESLPVHLVFQDGSTQSKTWPLRKKKYLIDVTSSKNLEFVSIDQPQTEKDTNLKNNGYPINLWSLDLHLFSSYSVPEYDCLVDEANRFWFAITGRKKEDANLTLSLLVYDKKGDLLLKRDDLSSPNHQSHHPILHQTPDQNIHLLWSESPGYEEKATLSHLTFTSSKTDIQIVHSDKLEDTITSFTRANFTPTPTSPVLVLQNNSDDQWAIGMYELSTFDLLHSYPLGQVKDPEDMIFIPTSDSYIGIWTEQPYSNNGIYFCQLAKDGQLLIPRTELYHLSANVKINSLNAIVCGDKITLLWNEMSKNRDTMYVIQQLSIDYQGFIIEPVRPFIGPTVTAIGELNIQQTPEGLQMVWADGRNQEPRPNREIIFRHLTEELVPLSQYRITYDRTGQYAPLLLLTPNGERYLTWRQYNDGQYHIFVKSTQPKFVEHILSKQHWSRLWTGIGSFFTTLITTMGLNILLILPISALPLLGILTFILLFSFYKIRNTRITWIIIILTTIFLKFINQRTMYRHFSQLQKVPLTTFFAINLITFILTAGIYFFRYQIIRKEKTLIEVRFKFLFGWIVLDSLLIFIANNFYGI